MKKREFLRELEKRLQALPPEERRRSVDFYAEIIADKMEDGMSEQEAIEELGDMEDIVRSVYAAASVSPPPYNPSPQYEPNAERINVREAKVIAEGEQSKKALSPAWIVLIVLGSVVWIPLLIAGAAVLFAGIIVVLALLFSLFFVLFALFVSGAGSAISGIVSVISGSLAPGIFSFGFGLMLVFGAILLIEPVGKAEKFLFLTVSNLAKRGWSLLTRKKEV